MSPDEEWRPIPGFPGYEVSARGRLRSLDRLVETSNHAGPMISYRTGCILSPYLDRGYYQHVLHGPEGRKCLTANVAVALAWHGPRPTPEHEAAHFDGDRVNNTPGNIRSATASENCADRIRHGTQPRGEQHGNAKLSDRDIREIRSLRARGAKLSDLAATFGICKSSAHNITSRRYWAHILPAAFMPAGAIGPQGFC